MSARPAAQTAVLLALLDLERAAEHAGNPNVHTVAAVLERARRRPGGALAGYSDVNRLRKEGLVIEPRLRRLPMPGHLQLSERGRVELRGGR